MAIKSIREVLPFVYCYSTPNIPYHDGWVKIGYTEQTVDKRLTEQTRTAGIDYKEEWHDLAVYLDGSGLTFTDDDFRAYLLEKGVNNVNHFCSNGESIGDEWYEIDPATARKYFDEFRQKPSITMKLKKYNLRDEQKKAVQDTAKVKENKKDNEFLWNAKPRFGKCLSCYDFCKETGAKNILIVTNRPAVANSWYDDYAKYIGRESGYFFVSKVSDISSKELVMSYEEYESDRKKRNQDPNVQQMSLIYFVSLQDIKGSCYFGGEYNKLKELTTIHWDILVVDESHEGVATYKTEAAFNRINRDFTLYLSGTPFKAIKDEKFDTESIYNWTYVSEQEAKERWNGEGTNPYLQMPKLNMLTYRLSNIIGELAPDLSDKATEEEGLNEFFKTDSKGNFVHEADVDKFLDVISSEEKYPFSEENRKGLEHTFWLLMRVDSVKALAKKLRNHPVFSKYEIVVAAGDGKADESDESGNSYNKVREAIANHDRTITLSVKQLTTGVTIPEWTGVMMLSERDSAAEYMQASFRAQNPYIFRKTDKMTGRIQYYRKTEAFVFDFNPEHTLDIVEQFANNLYSETANGKGDYDERKRNIDQLLKYMPVTGETDEGNMELLSSDLVLLIPRKMRSQEVVRRGFMCDMLFQNITNVFRMNNTTGVDIVNKLPICNQTDKKAPALTVTEEEIKDMHLNEEGNVDVKDDFVEEQVAKTVTQEEKEETKAKAIAEVKNVPISTNTKGADKDKERKEFVIAFTKVAQASAIAKAKEQHSEVVTKNVESAIKREVAKEAEKKANELYSDYVIESQTKEAELREEMIDFTSEEDKAEIEEMVKDVKEEAKTNFEEKAIKSISAFVDVSYNIGEKTVIETKANKTKSDKLDEFKKRLKGFTRTIPSFLMAYGCDEFTLEHLENFIPAEVFEEVTSITLDEFKILRDDCRYFEPTVFDDAVKVFLKKREELAYYFDDSAKEDIFDYIPPQKTNQIYTPKNVVKQMVDYLEQENPHCFDDADATFIDLYMKSGLYITEIVKRLYNSEVMKAKFPDDIERLNHIFSKQVYGLAPTEIIYRIATRYILGFNEGEKMIEANHLVQFDSLPSAQARTLEADLDKLFSDKE